MGSDSFTGAELMALSVTLEHLNETLGEQEVNASSGYLNLTINDKVVRLVPNAEGNLEMMF